MQARPYTPADYPAVASWWQAQSWPVIPEPMLPATGVIIDERCAGFLYSTDSAICWLEWIVANPSQPHEERGRALDLLLDELVEEARRRGFAVMFTSSNHPRLMERLKLFGFQVSDTGVTHLLRRM